MAELAKLGRDRRRELVVPETEEILHPAEVTKFGGNGQGEQVKTNVQITKLG